MKPISLWDTDLIILPSVEILYVIAFLWLYYLVCTCQDSACQNILYTKKENVKRCRDGMQCKQGRDDVKVKVNIQSPIPASFPH